MSEWRSFRLDELAAPARHAMTTGPFGSAISARHFVRAGVPVIRGGNLSADVGRRLIEDDLAFLDPALAARFERSVAARGDLVFTCWGTIGQVGLIDAGAGYDRYVVSNKQMKMTPDPAKADPLFLYYGLSAPAAVERVRHAAIGSSVPGFNLGQLRAMTIRCPGLAEQTAIASVLGALDDKIAANDRVAAAYEALLAARFAALGLGAPGDCPVTELIEFNPRMPRPDRDDAIHVDMAALPTRGSAVRAWTRRAAPTGSRFRNGDTLLARITPCLENGKTGYVDFLGPGEAATGSAEFIVLRARDGVPPEFCYFLARDERFRGHAIRRLAGSSGRQRVGAADAADFRVRRPDPARLAAFGAEAGAAFRHLRTVTGQSRSLAALRDDILPRLLSGRLKVADLDG